MTEVKKELTFEDKYLKPLQDELEKDTKTDRLTLQNDLLQLASIQSKWINYFSKWTTVRIRNDDQLKKLRAIKYQKALDGTSGFNVTKTEAKMLASMDSDIINLETRIQNIDNVLEFISQAQKNIRDKGFNIGNYIKFIEFEAGLG